MEQNLIDMVKLNERMEDDRELIREVFQVFIEEVPIRRAKFDKALSEQDFPALLMLAHSLKGASGTLQAEPLRHVSQALELAVREDRTGDVAVLVPPVLDLLDATAAHMAELLKTL